MFLKAHKRIPTSSISFLQISQGFFFLRGFVVFFFGKIIYFGLTIIRLYETI